MVRAFHSMTTLVVLVLAFASTGCGQTIQRWFFPMTGEAPFRFRADESQCYYVNGFTLDSAWNFFFIVVDTATGDTATLVKYSPQGKQLLRKTYPQFQPGPLLERHGKLYCLDTHPDRTDFYVIDANDGSVLQKCRHLTDGFVTDRAFRDESLVLTASVKSASRGSYDDTYIHVMKKFDLQGRYIGDSAAARQVGGLRIPSSCDQWGLVYLGKSNKLSVFYDFDVVTLNDHYYLVDSQATVNYEANIPTDSVGDPFCEIYPGVVLQGDNVFTLGRMGEQAVVSRFRLSEWITSKVTVTSLDELCRKKSSR